MKRPLLAGILLGVIVALVGAASYRVIFDRPEEAPQWIVSSYSGSVEVGTGDGAWTPVALKQRLSGRDRLRTLADGEATLVHGDSHVTVRPETELSVALLNADASRFQVAEGMVEIEARRDAISMRTEAGASVDAKDAGFAMSVKRDGFVEVQAKRGDVDFASMGKTETVHQGEQATAAPGQAPTAPVRIPDALLLNVQFPDAKTFNTRLTTVSGTTDPGQRVRIGGHGVPVDGQGHWSAQLVLDEGVNQIEVTAEDAMGRHRTERSDPIRVDTTAPTLTGAAVGSHAEPVQVTR